MAKKINKEIKKNKAVKKLPKTTPVKYKDDSIVNVSANFAEGSLEQRLHKKLAEHKEKTVSELDNIKADDTEAYKQILQKFDKAGKKALKKVLEQEKEQYESEQNKETLLLNVEERRGEDVDRSLLLRISEYELDWLVE